MGRRPSGSATTGAVARRTAAATAVEPVGRELEDTDPENQAVAGPSRHSAGPGRPATPAWSAAPRGPSSASVTSPRKRSVTCQRVGPTSRRFFSRPSSRAASRWRRRLVGPGGHERAHPADGVSRRRRRAAAWADRDPPRSAATRALERPPGLEDALLQGQGLPGLGRVGVARRRQPRARPSAMSVSSSRTPSSRSASSSTASLEPLTWAGACAAPCSRRRRRRPA